MPKQDTRDDLAKLLFIVDNVGAPDPEHEWEILTRHSPSHTEYVYIMADAIIAAGWKPPTPKPADAPVLAGQETIDTALGV